MAMKFTIITPSFNQLPYLKRCVASIADQKDVRVEHVVIDGDSTDGTVDWLERYAQEVRGQHEEPKAQSPKPKALLSGYSFSCFSKPDNGMYDALNKGISFALQKQLSGNCDDEIVAWLNCDEQYLPGALQRVARFFETHPEADFVYGDVLMVDPDGALLTYRKNPPLRRAYVLADHLYTQSAALFFRAGIFSSGVRFDPAWKAVGDCDFIVRTLTAGFRPASIKAYLAVCTMTGRNISRGSSGVSELEKFRRQAPVLFRAGRPVFNALRYLEKFLRGGYRQAAPLEYDLFLDDFNIRKKIVSETASSRFRWDDHE